MMQSALTLAGCTLISSIGPGCHAYQGTVLMGRLPCLSLSFLLCIQFSGVSQGMPASEPARLQQALALVQQGKTASALKAMGPLEPATSITPAYGRFAFLHAVLMQEHDGTEAALDAFNIVWQTYPPLADYAAKALAEAAATRDDDTLLEKLLSTLTQRYPYSLHLPSIYLLLAQTQRHLGRRQQALDTVVHVLQTYPSHPSIPDALFLRAQLEEEAGHIAKAAIAFKHVGDTYPQHERAVVAFKRSRQLLQRLPVAQRPRIDPERELNTLDSLIEARRWAEVQRRLKELAPLVQDDLQHSRFLLLRAVAAQRQRRWPQAMTLLKRLLLRYPQSPVRAEAHYRLAQLYRRQGREDKREIHLRHAMAQPHDAVWAPRATLQLAQILAQRQEFSQASNLYRHLGEHYPGHEEALPSLWRAAWLQYRQGHYDQAAQMWRQLAKQFSSGVWRPKVLYWLARAVEHCGDPSNAQALYHRVMTDFPYTYYGYQARQQLRRFSIPITSFIVQEQPYLPWEYRPPVTLPSPLMAQPSREQFHLVRTRELQQLQMYHRARQEIHALETHLPPSHATQFFLANLLEDNQEHLAALQQLNRIVEALTPLQVRGLSRDFWSLLYPKRFLDTVTRQTAGHDLSPYFILSLIRQESVFNPRAVSSVGARGLMQLMPATARRVARQTGLKRLRLWQLFDPQTNITLGTHYLAAQLRHFDNNPVFALAAYNAGPRRVKTWRQRWPELPMDEFVEYIPFKETRLYVKLILRNLFVYESLYPPMPDA
jgi:soluble lytic murein transglycosylase